MSLPTWTTEQLFSLAHDHTLVGAAETVADPLKWSRLACYEGGIWGEFGSRDNAPQHTHVLLPSLALSCDCPSRKFPCRHALGLALLYKRTPGLFPSGSPPSWLPTRTGLPTETAVLIDRHITNEQLPKVQAASNAYSLWLQDLIHSGLAGLPKKPLRYWQTMAQRLAENGLLKLAAELRQMPAATKIPRPAQTPARAQAGLIQTLSTSKETSGSDPDWPTLLLQQLGRHYLITQGFARYERLSPAAQADLRYAAGWFAAADDPWAESVHDEWVIAGTYLELRQDENIQHDWLWGQESNRFVLCTRTFPRHDPGFQPFYVGATVDATLNIYPGAWPFRVELETLHEFSSSSKSVPPTTSLKEAQQGFSRALSANPWLDVYPLALGRMDVLRDGQSWLLRDADGYRWPLPENFLYGWHLATFPMQEGLQIFGEWNGRFFTPLSFMESGRWLPMHILRGVK
jgi:hypothetical protein